MNKSRVIRTACFGAVVFVMGGCCTFPLNDAKKPEGAQADWCKSISNLTGSSVTPIYPAQSGLLPGSLAEIGNGDPDCYQCVVLEPKYTPDIRPGDLSTQSASYPDIIFTVDETGSADANIKDIPNIPVEIGAKYNIALNKKVTLRFINPKFVTKNPSNPSNVSYTVFDHGKERIANAVWPIEGWKTQDHQDKKAALIASVLQIDGIQWEVTFTQKTGGNIDATMQEIMKVNAGMNVSRKNETTIQLNQSYTSPRVIGYTGDTIVFDSNDGAVLKRKK